MLSNLCIISSRGEILIEEKYRKDVADKDLRNLISIAMSSKPGSSQPCIKYNSANGFSIKREKITYLAVSKIDMAPIVVIHFLENFYSLIKNFCGGATEDHITRNLLLLYEIMTECVDNGLIKSTNTEQIRHYIYSDPVVTRISHKHEVKKPGPFGLEKVIIPNAAAERPLVKSRSQQNLKAEVFVDVIEKLTAHFSKEGLIQRFSLCGIIQLKSFITFSHQIIVSLEDHLKQEGVPKGPCFDQHQFDNCVDDKNFEKYKSFIITPTQGEVKALTYFISSASVLPFRLISNIQESEQNSDCDLTLQLTCNLSSNAEALNITLHIPVPSCTRNVMQQFSMFENSAELIQKDRKILWKIKKLPGQGEVVAKFKLIEALQIPANRLELGPVSIEFEISNTTCSGLAIRNIKAEDPSGKIIPIQKWVRYVTLAQSYIFSL